MKMLRSLYCAGLLALAMCCSLALAAKEQHLKYERVQEIYELIFDDAKISLADMQQIAWLSPYYTDEAPPCPFQVSGSQHGQPMDKTFTIDKTFTVPVLELFNPGYADYNPTLNTAYLKNAAVNLEHGKKEVQVLKALKTPAVLEPVREYLRENLEFRLKMEQVRYAYYKTGDVEGLREILCHTCSCGPAQERLLQDIGNASTSSAKLKLTRYQWHNEVNHCHLSRSPKYPMEVWNKFLKEYGIQELHHGIRID